MARRALRLFNAELGTQIGWLVVPALAGVLGAALALRRRVLRDPGVLAATTWFVLGGAAYSITEGIVHPYYVASIVPPLALLIGVGAGVVRDRWQARATLPALGVAIAVAGAVSWVIARRSTWDIASALAVLTAVGGLLFAGMASAAPAAFRRIPPTAIAAATLAVLVVPFAWTVGSLKAGFNANIPYAEPVAGIGMAGGAPGDTSADDDVLAFLLEHRGDATWMAAAPSARIAAPFIIETGEPVIALGGFSGSDPILTVDEFDAMVTNGDVRYVYLGGQQGPGGPGGQGGGPGGQGGLTNHITSTCTPVADVSASLYDCG